MKTVIEMAREAGADDLCIRYSEVFLKGFAALVREDVGNELHLNLNCKSVQKRLATSWGYVKQDDCATALKVIHTWASVEGALVPEHVINLCDKALGRNEK